MWGRKPIFWICATGKSGLGHLRRCTSIAIEMRRLAPGAEVGLLTNAPVRGLPEEELAAFSAVRIVPRPDMADWLGKQAELAGLAVDTAVVDGLEMLDAPLALVLRETPRDRQARFAMPGGREWDLVLVPNPADHWLPDPLAVPARQTRPVGWIYRTTPLGSPGRQRAEVLVATGGGGTEETALAVCELLEPVIAQARTIAADEFDVVQALGPRAPKGARLSCADRTVDPGGDLNRHFAEADVVISTAGYNSVLELAALDVPSMLLAIPRSIDDQTARARLWGPRLGAFMGDGAGLDARAAGAWLAHSAMARQRRDPWPLGPSGAGPAARLLLGLGT